MHSTTSKASTWWSEQAAGTGIELLDRCVPRGADWENLQATGNADFQRARVLTDFPVGAELRALEIGCGAGRMTGALAQHFGQVDALDVSGEYLELARRNCKNLNISFYQIKTDDLRAVAGKRYDVVFSYEVFHYLDPHVFESYLRDVHDALNVGGQFVFELNACPIGWSTRISSVLRNGLHLLGKRTWRGWPTAPQFMRRYYSRNTLTDMLARSNLRISRICQPTSSCCWIVASKEEVAN